MRPSALRRALVPSQLRGCSGFATGRGAALSSASGGGALRRRLTPSAAASAAAAHLISYPTPANLSYFWGFGSLSAAMLALQIATGIFLAMHYNPGAAAAFDSVEHIMRDVPGGWVLRYGHANGASFFFVAVYLHVLRALLYRSTSAASRGVWWSGLGIFVAMMATAFLGYCLPWGQMSLWGATVITNLFSVLPLVGPALVQWLWGGFAVGAPTLSRFFALHYALPFLLAALVGLHLFALHNRGSSNPFGAEHREVAGQQLPLYPFFLVKDLLGLLVFAGAFGYFLFFAPNALGHSDNYIPANPLVTPAHIVPEWYFLPFYAILRSVPNKTLGVVAMAAALVLPALLPLESAALRSGGLRPAPLRWRERAGRSLRSVRGSAAVTLALVAVFAALGVVGARPAEEPFVLLGQLLTVLYFALLGGALLPAAAPLRRGLPSSAPSAVAAGAAPTLSATLLRRWRLASARCSLRRSPPHWRCCCGEPPAGCGELRRWWRERRQSPPRRCWRPLRPRTPPGASPRPSTTSAFGSRSGSCGCAGPSPRTPCRCRWPRWWRRSPR